MKAKKLNRIHIRFRYKISEERIKELRDSKIFPEPDLWRSTRSEEGIPLPYWRADTVEKFFEDHPEEDMRKDYHHCAGVE